MSEEQRQKLIRLIHIAKSQLHLADENYRALLQGCSAGKTSCAGMHVGELQNVLDAVKKLGFKLEGSRRFGGTKTMPVTEANIGRATVAQLEYIKGLWELCARNKTETALRAFVKRIAHVSDVRFLTERSAQPVINALRAMAAQAGYNPDRAQGVFE